MTKLSIVGDERVSLTKEVERLVTLFEKTGSIHVEIPTLLQSDLLLDLSEIFSRYKASKTLLIAERGRSKPKIASTWARNAKKSNRIFSLREEFLYSVEFFCSID